MKLFTEWLESRQVDDYVNQTLASQLNKLGANPRDRSSLSKFKQYGYNFVKPSGRTGTSMGLPGDYTVVAGDGGHAMFDPDDGQWKPLSQRFAPTGNSIPIGSDVNNVPEMPQPDKYDNFEPTTPTYPVGSGNWPDDPTQYSHYDRPRLKR